MHPDLASKTVSDATPQTAETIKEERRSKGGANLRMPAKRAQVDGEELIKDDEVMCTCLSTASIADRRSTRLSFLLLATAYLTTTSIPSSLATLCFHSNPTPPA
jgi:hypothetical protein